MLVLVFVRYQRFGVKEGCFRLELNPVAHFDSPDIFCLFSWWSTQCPSLTWSPRRPCAKSRWRSSSEPRLEQLGAEINLEFQCDYTLEQCIRAVVNQIRFAPGPRLHVEFCFRNEAEECFRIKGERFLGRVLINTISRSFKYKLHLSNAMSAIFFNVSPALPNLIVAMLIMIVSLRQRAPLTAVTSQSLRMSSAVNVVALSVRALAGASAALSCKHIKVFSRSH